MDEFNLDIDDMTLPEDVTGDLPIDHTSLLGSSHHGVFESGFDAEHPLPTYDQLRNAGFSEYLANQISNGGPHSYSEKELFHVLYETDNPVEEYNKMMEIKAQHAIDKADAFIDDIEKSGLLGSSIDDGITPQEGMTPYNPTPPEPSTGEQELGLADCWPLCKALTGEVSNNADYGFHA